MCTLYYLHHYWCIQKGIQSPYWDSVMYYFTSDRHFSAKVLNSRGLSGRYYNIAEEKIERQTLLKSPFNIPEQIYTIDCKKLSKLNFIWIVHKEFSQVTWKWQQLNYNFCLIVKFCSTSWGGGGGTLFTTLFLQFHKGLSRHYNNGGKTLWPI